MENDREKILKIISEIPELHPIPTPYYGGSRGKKTQIKESYDLDIVLYYSSEIKTSVRDIYYLVLNKLRTERDDTVQKNVAIRILKRDKYHIDVVPGKLISDNDDFACIYKSNQNKPLKTSVKKHIESVSEFAHRDILKLLKLWKVRNILEIPSFLLEQIAIIAMENVNFNIALDKALIHILEFISTKLPTIKIADPANQSNIITDEDVINAQNKKIVAEAAKWSLDTNNLETIKGWENVFRKKEQPPSNSQGNIQTRPRLAPDSPERRFG